MVLDQHPADGVRVHGELEEIPEEAGTPVGPVLLRLDNPLLARRIEFPVVAAPTVIEPGGARFQEAPQVPVDRPPGHPEGLRGLSLRDLPFQYL